MKSILIRLCKVKNIADTVNTSKEDIILFKSSLLFSNYLILLLLFLILLSLFPLGGTIITFILCLLGKEEGKTDKAVYNIFK